MNHISRWIPLGVGRRGGLHTFSRKFSAAVARQETTPANINKLIQKDGKLLFPVGFKGKDGVIVQKEFQVDTGSKYTFLNTETAKLLNLHSSYRLLGSTTTPAEETSFYYLSGTTAILGDHQVPLVVGVGPSTPNILGLNALLPLRASLNLGAQTFELNEIDDDAPNPFFNWKVLLFERAFHERNLRPVHWLMPPGTAVAVYGGNYLINLDTHQYLKSDAFPNYFGIKVLDETDPNNPPPEQPL